MGKFNVLSKTDQALVAYIISEGAGEAENVFVAKRAYDSPKCPFTVAFSDSARADQYPVYTVKAQINVFTRASAPRGEDKDRLKEDSDDRAGNTFDIFHLEEDRAGAGGHALADAITEAARSAGVTDFTVQNVMVGDMEQGFDKKECVWIDTLNLELVVTPEDVT